MTNEELKKHFGTFSEVARRLGISTAAIAVWNRNKRIPPLRQAQIQLLTRGRLKADTNIR